MGQNRNKLLLLPSAARCPLSLVSLTQLASTVSSDFVPSTEFIKGYALLPGPLVKRRASWNRATLKASSHPHHLAVLFICISSATLQSVGSETISVGVRLHTSACILEAMPGNVEEAGALGPFKGILGVP